MADGRVIGLDGRSRSARSVLAGADRASGERARRRRRTTPLLPPEPSSSGPDLGPTPPAQPAAKKSPAKQAPGTKAAVTKAAVTKAAVTKAAVPAKKVPAAKVPAAKVPAKKAAATKAPAKKAAATKAPATRAPARKAPATKAAAAKAPAKQAAAKKAARPPLSAVPSRPPIPVPPVRPRPVLQVEEPLPAGGRHSVALAIAGQLGEALLEAVVSRAKPADLEAKISSLLSFARRRITGEYELDEFGFDEEFTEAIPLALLKPLYKYWFRVEVRGIENIPAEGGALVVANHSGTVPLDAVMTAVAVHDMHPQHRFLRALGADLVFQTPFLAGLARRSGATLASNPDAERLLSTGHLVGVWPEGFKGIGKPFSERYKLQRFGRGGFVSAALRTGTPIIPCSIVGAEEIYPIIGDIPALARLLGFPYIPITPFFPLLGPLGAIPLPSKWLIEFGPPVETHAYGKPSADDPMLVFDLTDQVRQSIQQTLYSLLVQRRSIFF